jgi:hypothetical protein
VLAGEFLVMVYQLLVLGHQPVEDALHAVKPHGPVIAHVYSVARGGYPPR